jgi:hypothetical protein
MGTLHRLIEAQGKSGAIAAGLDRGEVEAAASYLADEDGGLGFAYSGWAQCALPHRKLADDAIWEITSDRVSLLVEPGRRPSSDGSAAEHVGIPYGANARLILLYLQTEALRTNSREVELGRSLRDWLAKMGISYGGHTGKLVRDQAERISRCRMTFHLKGNGKSGLVNQSIVDRALFIDTAARANDRGQGRLSLETAKLSEGFFEQLQKHPVPLEDSAIRALSNNSAALDAYIWLAYRLHALPSQRLVTWKALKAQFGTGTKELFHFKPQFTAALGLATAVYPAARIEIAEAGVILMPSKPPVNPKVAQIR